MELSPPTVLNFAKLNIMKSTLTYAALLSFTCLLLTLGIDAIGLTSAPAGAYIIAAGSFVSSLLLLTLVLDYERTPEPLMVAETREVMMPADEVFIAEAVTKRRPISHRRHAHRRQAPAV